MKIAMLLSCDSFESFFGRVLGLDINRYVATYRNDFAWYYGAGLLENSIQPTIYIPSLTHSGFYETETGVSVRFIRCASWYRPFAKLRRAFRVSRWSLYLQERINAWGIDRELRRALSEDGADLLYIQEYWGGRFDHFVHRCDVPVTAADHGGVAKGVVKLFKRRAFKSAAALYCQTRAECQTVTDYGGVGTLCSNGTDTTFFRPPPDGAVRTKTILTVARLTDKQKRTSDLVRSLKYLDSDWKLNIVGTGPDLAMLEKLAAEFGVESKVSFLGFKSRVEIRQLAQQCGVYAMPSSNEAVCLAVLEAMSCGAAVVTTRIRSFESLIEDGVNGYMVPVADPYALAKAIEKAWAQRAALGHRAAATVEENFDAKKIFRRLAQSLRAAVQASREPIGRQEAGRTSLIKVCE